MTKSEAIIEDAVKTMEQILRLSGKPIVVNRGHFFIKKFKERAEGIKTRKVKKTDTADFT